MDDHFRRARRISRIEAPLSRDQLLAALMLSFLGDSPHRIAAFFGVSHSTIYRWRDKVLASDSLEAEGLRRLIAPIKGQWVDQTNDD